MPIRDFFGALRRRWVLVLVGFLLTGGMSGAAYWFVKPTFEITGTVLLLPSSAASAANGGANPYLQLGRLKQAVDLVGVSLSDQTGTLEMKDVSKDVEFTVTADVRSSSPLLVVDVKDSSPETALRIRDILVARVPKRLEAMQQALSVSAKDRIISTVLTLDTQAQEVGRNRLRAAVAVGVAGLGLTLIVARLWVSRSLRHPRRRASARHILEPKDITPPTVATAGPAEVTVDLDAAPADPFEDTAETPLSLANAAKSVKELEEGAEALGDARR